MQEEEFNSKLKIQNSLSQKLKTLTFYFLEGGSRSLHAIPNSKIGHL
jgi:hypothetical protein